MKKKGAKLEKLKIQGALKQGEELTGIKGSRWNKIK
jgi:hypothetical protein